MSRIKIATRTKFIERKLAQRNFEFNSALYALF